MEDEPATKYCSNCKKDIASNNFSMHELHCKRHIVLCDYCDEPVPRADMDEHLEDYHGNTECDWCHLNMERYLLENHKEKECPEREIHCKYCDLKVKVTLFREHEATCGSRTDECTVCKKRVMLRFMDDHMQNDCISKPRPRKLINRHKPTASDGKHTVGANHSTQRNLPVASNRHQPEIIASPPHVGEYSPEDEEDDMVAVQPKSQVPYIHSPTSLVRSDGPVLKPVGLIPEHGRPGLISKPRHVSKPERPVLTPERPVPISERPVPIPERPVPMPERPVPMPERPVPMPDKPVPTHEDYSIASNSTVVIDQGWVGSVANAVKNDKELDLMIASSMYQEELRKNDRRYPQPVKAQEDVPPNPTSVSDEELAQRLQREYDQQRERSFHDAHLAKRMQDDTPTASTSVVDSVLNNPSHAHQLYDQLEEFSKEDSLLARQLQEEERFTRGGDDGGLNTMMIYDRAIIHEKEEEERLRGVERDHELASQLQQQEEKQQQERVNPPLHEHYQAESVPQYHHQSNPVVVPQPNTLTLDAYEGDDDDDIIERGVHQGFKQEQDDTPTSPPASHGIPCELCRATIDFDQYQQHLETMHPQFSGYVGRFQSHDTVYRPPSRPIDSPPPPRHPSHAPYRVTELDDKVECQFCGDKFSPRILEIHAFACSKNPEKLLKNVYGKPATVDDEVVTNTITASEDDVLDEVTSTIPCEFCRKDIPVLEYMVHSGECQRDHFARIAKYSTLDDEYGHEDGIPCSKCTKLIPLHNIHIHEVQCKGGSPEKTPAAPILHGSGIVHQPQDTAPWSHTPPIIQPPISQPSAVGVLHSRQPVNTVHQQTTAVLLSSDSEEEGEGTGVVNGSVVSDLHSSSEDILFCKYCGKPFMVSELDRHQRGCDKQKQRSFPSRMPINSLPTVDLSKQKSHRDLLPPTASMKQSNNHIPTIYNETRSREKQHARLIGTIPTNEGGVLDTKQRMKLTSKPASTSTTFRNTNSSKTAGSVPHSGMRDLSIHGRPLDGQGRRQDGVYAGGYNRNKSYSRKNNGDYGGHIDDTTGLPHIRPQIRRPKETNTSSQF